MEDINNYVRRIGELPKPDGTLGNSKQTRIYDTNGKAVTICGNGGGMGAKTGIYALQVGEPMMVHEAVASGFAVIPEGGGALTCCIQPAQRDEAERWSIKATV